MASSLVFRRLLSSNLVPKSLSSTSLRPIPAAGSRLFNTNACRSYDSDESDDTDVASGYRYDRSLPRRRGDFFSGRCVYSILTEPEPEPVSQLLNLVDQISENPHVSATHGGFHRGWHARVTDDALHLRFDLPGLGKEDVKVSVEKSALVIRGEGGDGEDDPPRRYSTGIELQEKLFKLGDVRAEMKNGVLKVVVPKIREEERSDVFHVKVV